MEVKDDNNSVYGFDNSFFENLKKGEKPVETPQPEQKEETPQETPQDNKSEEVSTPPASQEQQETKSETKDNEKTNTEEKNSEKVDIDALVQERLNQLKESGELIDKTTYEKSLEEREIKNDLLKKLAELDKGTGKVNKDFLRQYLTDWDAYDVSNTKQASSLIAQKLMETEGFDKETAELELEVKYPALFEEDPDTDSREYQRQLKLAQHEAKKFIAEKKEQQQSLALADPEQLEAVDRNKVIEEYTQQQAQKQKEIFDAWGDYSNSVVEKNSKLVHEVEGNTFEVTMTDEEKSALKNLVSNTPKLPDLFFKEGKLDEQAYQDFVLYGLMGKKAMEVAIKDAINIGEANKFKQTKSATSTSNQVPEVSSDKSQKAREILAKYGL